MSELSDRPLTQEEEAALKLCERCGEGLYTDPKIQGAADDDPESGFPSRLCTTCTIAGMSGTGLRLPSWVNMQPNKSE